MPVEWVIPAAALLLAVAAVMVRSRILGLQGAAIGAWSELDALLQRRHGLIRPLLESTQGLGPRQRALQDRVLAARKRATDAKAPPAIGRAETALTAELAKLCAGAEAHNEVAANPQFRRFRSEMLDIERRIATAQENFNAAAGTYNDARTGMPGGLLARVIHFEPVEYYGGPDAVVAERASRQADNPVGL